MLRVNDLSAGGSSVTVTAEGLQRVFSCMFPDSVGVLSLSAFGISSVVYFGAAIRDAVSALNGAGAGLTYKDVRDSIVGVISAGGGGLTIESPVFNSEQQMQSQLTCVLGSFFHQTLLSLNTPIWGCGIVLGGETGFSSNLQKVESLGVPLGTEVLLAYEVFNSALSWSTSDVDSTYVHSFLLTLGQKQVVGE